MKIRIRNNHRTNRLIQLFIIVGDFVLLWVLLYIVVGTIPQSEGWDEEKGRAFLMVCTLTFVFAEYLFPSVIHERVAGANDILRRSVMLVLTHTLLSYLLLRAIHFTSRLGWQLFSMGLFMLACIILLRFVERWLVKKFRQSGYNTRNFTLVGEDKELLHLYHKLKSNPTYGYRIHCIYGDIEGLTSDGSISDFKALLSQPEELKLGDEVYLCVPRKERELIEQTVRLCDRRMVKFYYLPTAEEKLNLQPILIDDIGAALGCGASIAALLRTQVGVFTLDRAVTLEDLEQARDEGTLDELVLPLEEALRFLDAVTVTPPQGNRFRNGGELSLDRLHLPGTPEDGALLRVLTQDNDFLGLGEVCRETGMLTVRRVFVNR